MRAPDFICIGAQKSGTSWLYQNLRSHPRVRFASYRDYDSLKEINFFDPVKPLRQFPDAPKTDAWYLSLFDAEPGQICGDISPAYARIDAAAIDHARRLVPRAKILFALRNPIDRAWSAVRWRMGNENRLDADGDDPWLSACVAETHAERFGDYLPQIEAWRARFGDQMAIFFYDELAESPSRYYAKVCGFLGIDPSERKADLAVDEIVFEGPPVPCPDSVRRTLSELCRPTIVACHDMFRNRFTQRWLDGVSDLPRLVRG